MAKKQAGDGVIGASGHVIEPDEPVKPVKTRKPAQMRIVKCEGENFIVRAEVCSVKMGVEGIDVITEPGKYAVITIREVREIGEETKTEKFNRKGTL